MTIKAKKRPGPKPGFKMTKAHKDNISKALAGKSKSKEHVANIKKNHADFTGEKNPMYGISSPNKGKFGRDASAYKDGSFIQFKAWHTAVLERDNYTCQVCGKSDKEVRLDCHHIKPKSKYPEFIHDINYGITLCMHCHPRYENKLKVLLKIVRSKDV